MKITFILSHHAILRIVQRQIEDPNNTEPIIANSRIRKKILSNCTITRYDFSTEYFVTNEIYRQVYVCRKLDTDRYLVITAFRMNQDRP